MAPWRCMIHSIVVCERKLIVVILDNCQVNRDGERKLRSAHVGGLFSVHWKRRVE